MRYDLLCMGSALLLALFGADAAAQGRRGGAIPETVDFGFEIPPAPALSPLEEMQTFQIAEGFRLELVASEPLVVDPVAMTFDPDGRMWVCEMRGFMPNVDGDGEDQPVATISILEDTTGDGVMDRRTLFLDGLVMPRAVCWTLDGLLLAEQGTIWLCVDRDGDLRCDDREAICEYIPGNLEHALNGLMPALDNWIYNAKEGLRLRKIEGHWVAERTIDRGQWGITQDDYGRLYYNVNAQLIRGDLIPAYFANAHAPNPLVNVQLYREQEVFPIRPNPGINRGYDPTYLRPDGSMIQANSDCGPVVYRGDNLPRELYGDIFIPETVGNLVRRQVLVEEDGETYSRNAYDRMEFLASTDERFRPVNMYNAPDGTLYLLDMYRGVVQHADFVTPFLRRQILDRDLEEPINLGRIFRVVHETTEPRPRVSLSTATGEELVGYLSHPNGWHRDMAQQLLVQRGDRSVIPALKQLAASGENPLGRLHAAWTLEGLNDLDPELLYDLLDDADANVRATAVQFYGRLLNLQAAPTLLQELEPLAADPVADVRLQVALNVGLVDSPIASRVVDPLLEEWSQDEDQQQAYLAGFSGREVEFLTARLKSNRWAEAEPWREELLTSIAGLVWQRRDPLAMLRMLHLIDGQPAWQQIALLEGLGDSIAAGRGGRRGADGGRDRGGRAGGGRGRGRGTGPGVRLVVLPTPPEALEELQRSDDPRLAEEAQRLSELLAWPGKDGQPLPERPPLSDAHQALYDQGRVEYLNLCAACHHPVGYGDAAKGPSLLDSDWLIDDERVINVALHGLRGPIEINGQPYNTDSRLNMPPLHQTLSDEKLAGILTFIRREFTADLPPVEADTVTRVRAATTARGEQWTQRELLGQ